MAFPTFRMMGDKPRPGEAKLRIRGNGDPLNLDVYVVDDAGVERHLLGVTAVALDWRIGERGPEQAATLTVLESEVDIVAANGSVVLERSSE